MFLLLFFFSSTIVRKKHDTSERPIDTYINIMVFIFIFIFVLFYAWKPCHALKIQFVRF